ncbi:hypothetical protein [Lysobacter tyrosinilyticus]
MDRLHCSRRMQVALAIIATIAVIVVGVAIKLGNDMAGYLETSVAHTAEDIAIDGATPSIAPAPRGAPTPAVVASSPSAETGTAGDAADPRTDTSVASVH